MMSPEHTYHLGHSEQGTGESWANELQVSVIVSRGAVVEPVGLENSPGARRQKLSDGVVRDRGNAAQGTRNPGTS